MQLKNGLAIFVRTNSKGHWNIASFHSPHSLTWRWIFSFSSQVGQWIAWPLWWGYRTNGGPHWGFRIPFVGCFTWQTQQPMWYRDMYVRMRDEQEVAAGRMVRGSAYRPPPPIPPIMPEQTSTRH